MNIAAQRVLKAFVTLAATTLWGCGGGAETETDLSKVDPTIPSDGWEMVWSDEFDGSSIDTAKWNHEVNCDGGGNFERQCYTDSPENSFVADGMLNIVAKPAAEGAEKPYTSARMTTQNKGDFKYGRIEMRAKLPFGQGSWPAFWMMPTDSVYGIWPKSGEIDIVEAVNLKEPRPDAEGIAENRVFGTLHYGNLWNDKSATGQEFNFGGTSDPSDDFHTYAIEWQEGEIRWYIDGELYQTQRKSTLVYNSNGDPVALQHEGWYTEYAETEGGYSK